MIGLERRTYILNRLLEKGTVSLSDISNELNSSIATIRRDFDKLVSEGKIERVHGGAVLTSELVPKNKYKNNCAAINASDKEKMNLQEKSEIARKAASFVNDGDYIYLDTGTTVCQMIDYLTDKKVTIVTPSILVLEKVKCLQCNLDVILVGGRYNMAYETTVGPVSEQQIQQFYYNIAFFGCSGVDFDKGAVYYDESDSAALKMPAFINADKKILLADSSKLNKRNFWSFLETSKFDKIISKHIPNDNHEYPDNVIWTNK